MTMSQSISARSTGVSLIELMVALAITALLLLGVSEIFLGSRATFTVQQAMSRSQENARFAFNVFENSIRMAGYLGCSNDKDSGLAFFNHIPADPSVSDPHSLVRFERPIEGFEYTACNDTACDTDGNEPAVGGAGEWSPSLTNSGIPLSASANPVKGSDVLVLRVVNAESAPVLGDVVASEANPDATFSLGPVAGDSDFLKPYGAYAATTCGLKKPRSDVFLASAASSGTSLVAGSDINLARYGISSTTWDGTVEGLSLNKVFDQKFPPQLNAEVHSASYIAFFVGLDAAGNPALKMQHYSGAMNGALPGLTVEDLADGVEAMQVLYGVDTNDDGLADGYFKASEVATMVVPPHPHVIYIDDSMWRDVVSVRVGLLMRGQDVAGVPANSSGNKYTVEDAVMTRPADGRYRDVYETTIALRNRLPSS